MPTVSELLAVYPDQPVKVLTDSWGDSLVFIDRLEPNLGETVAFIGGASDGDDLAGPTYGVILDRGQIKKLRKHLKRVLKAGE